MVHQTGARRIEMRVVRELVGVMPELCFLLAVSSLTESCGQHQQSPLSPIVNADTVDVFPLSKGLSVDYLYNVDDVHQSGAEISVTTWTDSGTVHYTIEDSVTLSSGWRAWIVRENVDLIYRHFSPIGAYETKEDTSYRIEYTTVDSLFESMTGNHELRCGSLIWCFPSSDSITSTPNWLPSIQVARYSSKDSLSLGTSYSYWNNSLRDSLSITLQNGKGLIDLYSTHFEGDTHENNFHLITATLLGISESTQKSGTFKSFGDGFRTATR
jgi:hypothetical protein